MSLERHNTLAFHQSLFFFIYLRVSIFVGRPKGCYFQHIADSIKIKLANWKAKVLSMAGVVQLVKSTILSKFIHCLAIYHWPGSSIKMIEKWLRNFIWSGNKDTKNTVAVAWKICYKKQNEGGLGILSLKDYNTATNMHLCWRFINDTLCWSRVLKARDLRNGRTIKYAIKSSIWHGTKELHGVIMENCVWSIGTGKRVNFWIDNWVGESLVNTFHIHEKYHFALTSRVSEVWVNSAWYIKNNIQLAFPSLHQLLASVSFPKVEIDASYVWNKSKDGQLSLKGAYNTIAKPKPLGINMEIFPLGLRYSSISFNGHVEIYA